MIGWTELGYQLIYLLGTNMVNEHSTTKWTKWAESFFPREQSIEKKIGEKNRFAENLNQAEIPTALLKQKSNLPHSADLLGQQETTQK